MRKQSLDSIINGDTGILETPAYGIVVETKPVDYEKEKRKSSFCKACMHKFKKASDNPCKKCREINKSMPVSYYKEVVLMTKTKKEELQPVEMNNVEAAKPAYSLHNSFLIAEACAHSVITKSSEFVDASKRGEIIEKTVKILSFYINGMKEE